MMQYLYRLNYPQNWDEHTPIAIALHGMGTNYNDLQPVLDQIASDQIQLSLQGDQVFQDGYQFFNVNFERGSKKEETVIGTAIENVYSFIQQLLTQKKLTAHPLHYLGFSQGAIIGSGLVVNYPKLFQQVELFSGRLPLFVEQTAQATLGTNLPSPQIFISQGSLDPLFSPEIGRHVHEIIAAHFANVHYHEYQVGHGITPQTLADVQKENNVD
ncbi:MAG TPA: hypothetical protein K8V00_01385 [Ligilactobacillus acidipiscis]|uniref:Phospholipase/carboxylesterase/thioesterase domain-containing protein n=1 Tax=Ligilactobacillus acidipiscis TaxID=89059 RepID=A0A921K016_9LACO|nr:hypothetical protein [Ligilactobacillus acidipiscis]